MSTPSASSGKKICIVCGEDCSNKPRLKDAQGRYCCKACEGKAAAAAKPAVVVKNAQVPKTAPAAAPATVGLGGLDDEPIDFGAMPAEGSPAMAMASCPGCASPVATGTTLCMSCGYNLKTGKKSKTKVSKEGPGAGEQAAKLDGTFIQGNPLMWCVGAGAGGLVGAFAWAYLMLNLRVPSIKLTVIAILLISAALGFLVGLGTVLMARAKAGLGSATIAVIFAAIAYVGGHWYWSSMALEKVIDKLDPQFRQVSGQDINFEIAVGIGKGTYPSKASANDKQVAANAEYLDDVPESVMKEAEKRRTGMSETEINDIKEEILRQRENDMSKGKKEVFSASWSFFDAFGVLAAIVIAWKVGSGGNA